MKRVTLAVFVGLLAVLPMQGIAAIAVMAGTEMLSAPASHGGGCRKSSPPGQCCHMDNKAGSVHCH